jgi:hypothetical protein
MPLIPPNRITAFPLKDDLAWYDPDVVFQPFDDIFGRGVVGSTDLQVVANGGGDGQISVQAGRGYVPYANGGKRLFKTSVSIRSDAAEFLTAIPAWGGGNPRVHRIIARIRDATLTPADQIKGGVFDVLPGTATAGATLANLSGAQAVPADSLLLGNVLQNGATIPSGNIDSTFGTVRARARIGAGNSPTKILEVNGATLTDRGATNFIAGSNMTITAADNAAADSADITFAATVPPQVVAKLFDYTVAGSAKATIDTFSDGGSTNLSGAYSSLLVICFVQSSASGNTDTFRMRVNNNSSTVYDDCVWGPVGVNFQDASQARWQIGNAPAATLNNRWGAYEILIPNYTTTTHVTGMWRGIDPSTGTGGEPQFGGGRFSPGGPVTRLSWLWNNGSFQIGSSIQVYGIL